MWRSTAGRRDCVSAMTQPVYRARLPSSEKNPRLACEPRQIGPRLGMVGLNAERVLKVPARVVRMPSARLQHSQVAPPVGILLP